MKTKLLVIPVALSVILTGCVHSHMHEVVVSPHPATPPPTSSSSAVRVYNDSGTPGVASESSLNTVGSPAVPADDMDRAVAVRNMMHAEPPVRMAAKNVDIEIKNGVAILRGTVKSEGDRQLLVDRVGASPGISSLQDRLSIAP